MCLLLVYILVSILSTITYSVDRSKFRTCESTGFCRIYRHKTIGPVYHDHVSLSMLLILYTLLKKLYIMNL